MAATLDDLLGRLNAMPEKDKREFRGLVMEATRGMVFIPTPGPQTEAYFSKADILLYGGEPGGGKTGVLLGLALNEHDRSLIVRKQFADLEGLIDNAKGILGTDEGFVGGQRPKYRKPDGGVIHFEGMSSGEGIDTGKQGTPHDFIGVDEGAQLPENAIRMLMGWNRTTKKGQRCRMVIASNPPLDSVGDWMLEFFGPWLDRNHPNPAEPGELRYFIIDPDGRSKEVEGPEPVEIDGEIYEPHSRSFIPAGLDDNPFIDKADYRKRLQAMPEPYRTILMTGNFMYARKDAEFQVIPTDWVNAAQARWTRTPPEGMAMTAMGFDPAGGGSDKAVLAMRYGGWYGELVSEQGEHTADGSAMAALVTRYRRDACPVVVDMGGGYGGAVTLRLKDNGVTCVAFNGANGSTAKTVDGALTFENKRAEAYWRFREALDPDQEGGSVIALPPDPELRADLTAPTFDLGARGIRIEPKEKIRERLNRSPDRGDAVVMALSEGNAAQRRMRASSGTRPRVDMGRSAVRRRRPS